MLFKEAVLEIRDDAGIKMKDLNDAMGYAFSTGLLNTLNRCNNITLRKMMEITDYLGYDVVLKPRRKGKREYKIDLGEE